MIRRHAYDDCVRSLKQRRGVALLGARQTGKSTLARALVDEGHLDQLISLDEGAVRAAAHEDPAGFVASLSPRTAIDEIQRVPELMLEIKRKLDGDSTPGQFLLTGSADLLTAPMIRDTLPGRIRYIHLWPLSQGELIGRRETFLDRAFTDSGPPQLNDQPVGRSAYVEAVTKGGYPEALRLDPRERSHYFEDYLDSALGRDLPETSAIRKLDAVERVLGLVAARSSGIANFAAIGKDAGVSPDTARSHIKALELLFLVHRLPAWHANLTARRVKSPKFHVADSGLLTYLLELDEQRLADPGDGSHAGPVFESFVAMELARQTGWSDRDITLHHFRDSARREVDVIASTRSGDMVAIEVKSGATVRAKDFNSLKYLREQIGEQFKRGIVLYTGERSLPFGDRLSAQPLSALWLT